MVIHLIERKENDPQGYGDGLSDIVSCACGETFGEVQEGGFEEACGHLENLLTRTTELAESMVDELEDEHDCTEVADYREALAGITGEGT